jgi:hypothetical protein
LYNSIFLELNVYCMHLERELLVEGVDLSEGENCIGEIG